VPDAQLPLVQKWPAGHWLLEAQALQVCVATEQWGVAPLQSASQEQPETALQQPARQSLCGGQSLALV